MGGGAFEAMLPGASPPTDGVVVVGFGRTLMGPDVVMVSFGTECYGGELAVVMHEAATRASWAIEAARGLGVSDANIRAAGCNLWTEPTRDPGMGSCNSAVTYRVSKHVNVNLHDPDQLGPLVRTVTGPGLFTLAGVNFSAKDPSSLIRFQSLLMSLEDK